MTFEFKITYFIAIEISLLIQIYNSLRKMKYSKIAARGRWKQSSFEYYRETRGFEFETFEASSSRIKSNPVESAGGMRIG